MNFIVTSWTLWKIPSPCNYWDLARDSGHWIINTSEGSHWCSRDRIEQVLVLCVSFLCYDGPGRHVLMQESHKMGGLLSAWVTVWELVRLTPGIWSQLVTTASSELHQWGRWLYQVFQLYIFVNYLHFLNEQIIIYITSHIQTQWSSPVKLSSYGKQKVSEIRIGSNRPLWHIVGHSERAPHSWRNFAGLPWWHSGWESTCQCRGHGFEPWSGRIPHAAEWLGPWATTTEPARLEPVLRNKRGRDSERPAHRDEEWPPLATTRESPRTETKTQHSHK